MCLEVGTVRWHILAREQLLTAQVLPLTQAGLLFWLVISHFALDYPLQGDAVAVEKSRHSKSALQAHVPWYYWLTAHALMHAGGVALVTGSVALGGAELCAHWAIDFGKCERWYGIHVDQALHLACKVAWLCLAVRT